MPMPADDDDTTTYRVVRMYRDRSGTQTIARGLTLAEAREHCRDPETSSSSGASAEALARTAQFGPWFDGYEEE